MEIKKTLTKDLELEKEFNALIPGEMVVQEAEKSIVEMQKTYRLDGFRKGKVPIDAIRNREFNALFYRHSERMIDKFVRSLRMDNDYTLVLEPRVTLKTLEVNRDVEFTVVYELMPKIEKIDLGKIKLDVFKVSIEDRDVDKSVGKILENYKKFTKREGEARIGDRVVINFSGTIGGESFAGGSAEDYRLDLGSKTFIGNFEEQIVGRSAGEEFDVSVTFPGDYHSSSLADKTAIFRVKLLDVLKPEERVLDEEFVRSTFGINGIPEFTTMIRNELVKTYEKSSRNDLIGRIVNHLRENISFNLPGGLVEGQLRNLSRSRKIDNIRNSETAEIDTESLRKEAEARVKIGLILSNISKDNDISVSDPEVTNAIMREAMGVPGREKAVIDYYRNDQDALESIRNRTLENRIMDFIVNSIEKNEISISAEEFEERTNG
ncbi:MAG: trigger factor [Rickettsiales bacterium]|jgi:trigger factor|nr:trigger factor [Rickettsiales bacterium]